VAFIEVSDLVREFRSYRRFALVILPSSAVPVPISGHGASHLPNGMFGAFRWSMRQAVAVLGGRKVARGTRAIMVPATQQVYQQALAEGLIDQLVAAGVAVSTPTCGACFGGHMGLLDEGEVAITTTNRNLRGRMGHAGARVYLANAYVAAAAAVAGEIVDPAAVVGVAQPAVPGGTA
jgi:hypothetical protein